MSEDEQRMQRAARIRQMREGPTDDTDASEESSTDDEPNDAAETDGSGARQPNADPTTVEGETEPTAEADAGSTTDAESTPGPDTDIEPTTDATPATERAETSAETEDSTPDATTATETSVDEGSHEASTEPDTDTGEEAATVEKTNVEDTDETGDEEMEDAEPPADAPAGVGAEADTASKTESRVLEFTLGAEQYCLDIQYIEEIVKRDTITRVPNTPDFVQGVVDLRGQITTILNPKEVIGIDEEGEESLIVVFDAEEFDEQGNIGWLVDDVRQVTPVTDDQINDSPMGEDYINGIIDREEDEQFVIWTTPDLALDVASS